MARRWATALAALGWAASAPAWAQPPATALLCDNLRALDQAAQRDFYPILGRERRAIPFMSGGPRLYNPALVLPEAGDCNIRASGLRARFEYYCFWNSKTPDFAAGDFGQRIGDCLGTEAHKSDFDPNIVLVTPSGTTFLIGADDKFDHYRVELRVDGPAP